MISIKKSVLRNVLQQRCNKCIRNHITTASTPTSSTIASLPFTNRILEPLKDFPITKGNVKSNNNKITNSSYLDLRPEKYEMSDDDKITKYYSSKNDDVSRRPYEREINYLKNMLETFSAESYFERTFQILKSLSKLVNHEELTQIGNKSLEILVRDSNMKSNELSKVILQMEEFCNFKSNERTEAIILKTLLQNGGNINEYFEFMDDKRTIKKILQNTDVIGADNMFKIFDSKFIDQTCIPQELTEVYKNYKLDQQGGEVVEDTIKLQQNVNINPLDKQNLDELLPVDSFGLKVVRHSLLGLKPDSGAALQFAADVEEIVEDLDDEVKNEIKSGKLNYFEIYKRLKTDEQKQQFTEVLEVFNTDRQRQIEIRGIEGAKEKWKHDFEEAQKRGDLNLSKSLNAQCYEWYKKLIPLIEKEHELCKALLKGDKSVDQRDSATAKDRAFYAPFLIKVDAEKAAVVTILELLKLNASGGVVGGMRAAKAIGSVGRAIELEYRTSCMAQQEPKLSANKKLAVSQQMKKIIRKSIDSMDETGADWDNGTRSRVGGILVSFMMAVARVKVRKYNNGTQIEDYHPAFFHGMQFIGGQRIGVIKIHNEIAKNLTGTSFTESIQPQSLPMLVKPKPWSSFYGGGGLYSRNPLVRMRDAPETEAYVKAAAKRDNLDEVFEGLNVLGTTAWTINKKVFDVISQYWNTGEEFLTIPPVLESANFPEKLKPDADPKERYEHNRAMYNAARDFAASRSQRCDYNYKLEIARGFIGEKLYFPHNLDFRGRAYPISPHLNHLGGDLTRALFLFWEGQELGESGLDWLKIQLANVYGVDKAPLSERIQFSTENLENILKSAENPLKNNWWTKAEKPWQALSVCFELAEAYKLPDPTKFVSHLPVHQDGTCNGLQHYAALGGDIEGAKQVNLNPADRPQDVYTYVAKLVENRVKVDAENGNEIAIFLQDKIKRKVVKQTVMTNVYGVTFVGALAQIKKQVIQHFGEDQEPHKFVKYLTVQVFASIRELFENAHLIQDWLGEAAKRISKSVSLDYGESADTDHELHSSAVIWTTPLGLPCVQPYRLNKHHSVKTLVQDVLILNPSGTSTVDARKQQAGFPPNFIHSLDATHMLMTATGCGKLGLSFASVHDSFWTHAANVNKMNSILRDQFVRLHTTDLVQLLRDEFIERYKGSYQILHIPLDHELTSKVKAIKKQWATSIKRGITITDELYMERKRLEMLNSNNPEEVEAAKKLETTLSVVQNYDPYSIKVASKINAYDVLVPLEFPEVPPKGEFDVNKVKDSHYFFS
ncbi:RPO41 [Candida pseudojiufengensis]|uniref:RPO41 n=1 Tax=Candida pseudojiufengensis TaxID=497109 RepID=UPI0022246DE2|nr:RPO41 [Candida pseudojiufengensis]KAI5966494.1 RPO41 [Candida pseudojiufengensis]